MTDPSSRTKRKRTPGPDKRDEPTVPFIQLQVPPGIDADLPVWHALRSHQVDIAWSVSPYCINVLITPKPSTVSTVSTVSTPQAAEEAKRCRLGNDDLSTTNQPPPIVIQPLQPQYGDPQNGSIQPQPQHNGDPQNGSIQPQPQHNGDPRNISDILRSISVASGRKPFITGVIPVTSKSSSQHDYVKKALYILLPTERISVMPSSPGKPALTRQGFHTKQPCDVLICDKFLLNVCRKGESCAMHHTPYPFHWQLLLTATGQWVDVNPRCQLGLERLYCDVNNEEIDIKDGLHKLSLNLDLMEVNFQMGSKYSGVRRLSNTRDSTKNPRFPTKWHIYRKEHSGWEEYTEDLSKLLLGKMADKEVESSFHIGSREYRVDFTDMTQTRVHTGFRRSIRCRPTYLFPESMQLYLDQTGILHASTPTPSEPPEPNFSVNPLEGFPCWYPPVWSPVPHEDYRLVDVPAGTRAFLAVQSMFHRSISKVDVVSIQQIQNLLHWDKFQRQKAYMLKHYSSSAEPVERHLFHGTSINAVEPICRNNFDPRLAGVNETTYGLGSYFSCDASYSNSYSTKSEDGLQHMFLAKVLVGKTSLGIRSYRRPPEMVSDLRFDTCVNCVEKPSIFVVFDSCQCYPYYLIKYKELVIDITQ